MMCVCGSEKEQKNCCELIIKGIKKAETAEELMRSRYTAYTQLNVAYIIETTLPKMRKYYSPAGILEWAKNSTWLKLEILELKETTVKFEAHYLDENKFPVTHKEHSTFKKENGNWYFVDGNSFE